MRQATFCFLLLCLFTVPLSAQDEPLITNQPPYELPKRLAEKLSLADQEMFTALGNVHIESAWGALSGLGYPRNFTNEVPAINPDIVMIGRARTYEMLPGRKDIAVTLPVPSYFFRLVDDTNPGDILVFAMGGMTEVGAGGDVSAQRFVYLGGAGMLFDGAIHDLTLIRHYGMPIFARKGHTSALQGRLMYTRIDVPVAFAGVTIASGDILYGNVAGILVIPKDLVWEVIKIALERDVKEEFMRIWLQQGAPVIGTYTETKPNEAFNEAYKKWKREKGYE